VRSAANHDDAAAMERQDTGIEVLRYSSDARPGITRRRAGRGFSYRAPDGSPIRDREVLSRIRALAVPPAWTEVWICPDPAGHVQATGRDARRRKQYRYHARWRTRRDDRKYLRVAEFGRALPRIRRRVGQDLALPGLPREKVLATVVRLLESTSMRVGNAEYARSNRSFGLTTLRNRHAIVDGSALRFRFRGKGGRVHEVDVRDRRLASIVARCQELPGQELFQYLDSAGEAHAIESADVNAYLRLAAGVDVTAKDFRTWTGSLLAFQALRRASGQASPIEKGTVTRSVETVAEALGNTAAVSRGSYIAPAVIDAYLGGALSPARASAQRRTGLSPELAVISRRDELSLIRVLEAGGKPRGREPRGRTRRRV
jgi:DNA topoisomerase-1